MKDTYLLSLPPFETNQGEKKQHRGAVRYKQKDIDCPVGTWRKNNLWQPSDNPFFKRNQQTKNELDGNGLRGAHQTKERRTPHALLRRFASGT